MVPSAAGVIAVVDLENGTRARRRRAACLRFAVAVMLALAPLACDKDEEPPAEDAEAMEDGAAEEPAGTEPVGNMDLMEIEDPPQDQKDRELALLGALNGSWRSLGEGRCTQVDLDLAHPAPGDYGTGHYHPPFGQPARLTDLYRHPQPDTLGGVAPSGGPNPGCTDPNTMQFYATVDAMGSDLTIYWRCRAPNGETQGNEIEYYRRGACAGATDLTPAHLLPAPPDGGAEPPASGDEGSAGGEASNDGSAGAMADQESATDGPAACTMVGTWRQSTVDVGQTEWEIAANGEAEETGIGYAKGLATLTGRKLSINWSTNNGYSGTYSWDLTTDCRTGTGTLVFATGRKGTHDSVVTR